MKGDGWEFCEQEPRDLDRPLVVPAFEAGGQQAQGIEGLLPETLCSAVSSCVAQSTKLGHVFSSIRRHIVVGDKENENQLVLNLA